MRPTTNINDQTDEPLTLDTSNLVFTEGSAHQRRLAWELNASCGGPLMTPADYVSRERMLSEQELTRDGRCRYWVLHPKGRPDEVLASCEGTRKVILMSENGKYKRGYAYALSNIHTTPVYRRLGLAALILRRVKDVIDRDSDCSILYSDVGKNYYTSLGWTAFPSEQVTIYLLRDSCGTLYPPIRPVRTRFLTMGALRALCEADVSGMKSKFRGLLPDGNTHVAITPSFAQISWQLARSDFMAKKVYGKNIVNRGAITDNGSAWIYWDHDWREKKLKVLRVVSTPSAHNQHVSNVKLLLEAALAEASAWGLSKVSLWNPDDALVYGCKALSNAHVEALEVVFEERVNKSIPSFRWAHDDDTKRTVWEENFFYCWC